MKKIILIVVLSASVVGNVFIVAQQQSFEVHDQLSEFVLDQDVEDEDFVLEYDEYDRLADADPEPMLHGMRDYIPGWVKALGIRLLLTYFSIKEYVIEHWVAFKKRLAIVYGAQKIQEQCRHEA